MIKDNKILLGQGDNPVYLLPKMANRHGLIAGATGTGKTTTLKILVEGFSQLGVPVFLADIKGDVSSLALAGSMSDKTAERLNKLGVAPEEFIFQSFPCRFWDVFGKKGIPVRATVSDIGPALIGRLMNATDAQMGVLNIAFHVADDNGFLLEDYKDLRAILTYIAEHRNDLSLQYGNVSTTSVSTLQRSLLTLEDQGAEAFLGEPSLDINDWMATDANGKGMVNILHCAELVNQPLLYATFMLWMLGELYENMPEVGDLDKPKLVFFFDEAHMLFHDAPKALLDKITQVVKLVRSKGVGIYFITQSPADIPDAVLSQLNNRIQHALRAYTPADQKAVRVAAQSFRANPNFKTEDAISTMGTGVALVSTLDEHGAPTIVEQAVIAPPQSSFTALEDPVRYRMIENDSMCAKYKDAIDNESAYELIMKKNLVDAAVKEQEAEKKANEIQEEKDRKIREKEKEREERDYQKLMEKQKKDMERQQKELQKKNEQMLKTIGRASGKAISRGILGTSSASRRKATGELIGSVITGLFR